jgi:hypothetical protein
MVCWRMGLLDDAIREHMELKRLNGADPSEVARQEQDALGPVLREENPTSQVAVDDVAEPEGIAPEDVAVPAEDPQGAPAPDFANVGQETAELDMRTVLDDEEKQDGEIWLDAGSPGSHTGPAQAARETGGPSEPAADVLEETPDFLRDTPEQERLWFEQQPPRDFDFDK